MPPRVRHERLSNGPIASEFGVIAVERDGQVITDLEPGFRFERDDALVVAGPDEAVNRFNEFAK